MSSPPTKLLSLDDDYDSEEPPNVPSSSSSATKEESPMETEMEAPTGMSLSLALPTPISAPPPPQPQAHIPPTTLPTASGPLTLGEEMRRSYREQQSKSRKELEEEEREKMQYVGNSFIFLSSIFYMSLPFS
jgi:hypothetical protein